MYRYESDYIMRMIHLLRLLYEHLLGITDSDRLRNGEDAIRETMGKLTGLTPDAAMSLDVEQLCEMLGDDGEGMLRRFALAELLRMQGELYESFAFAEDAEPLLRKSLLLYLSTAKTATELKESTVLHAQKLYRRFFSVLKEGEHLQAGQFFEEMACYADAEDAYCAMDDALFAAEFYRRLFALSPEELARGGFTNEETQDGFMRITRILGIDEGEDGSFG